MLVEEPLVVSSSFSPFRPGLSVLRQLSSEVAGAGDGLREVEVDTQGSSQCTSGTVVCAYTQGLGMGMGLSPGGCAGSHGTQQHRRQQGPLKVSNPCAQQVSPQHEVRTAVALCSRV